MNDEMMLDGVLFVDTLRREASEKGINTRLVHDWRTIADWLNSDGSALTPAQSQRVLNAWRAYVAIGMAPSFKLQEAFDTLGRRYLQQYPDCKGDKAPTNVMDVFDRLIATDSEIAEKRVSDLAAERARFGPIIEALAASNSTLRPGLQRGWWRRLSFESRQWLYGCSIWALGVLGYYWVFDPYERRTWANYGDEELTKMVVKMALPALVWILKAGYGRFVR
ncbi:MAG TPA: hypothetical protein VGO18_11420 [Steroidobacteraceae bacterium]|jgi:hypothetical protein|nr:hypothetical protein [Steroidobacteraceae bacterium]